MSDLLAAARRIIAREKQRAEEIDGKRPDVYDYDAVLVAAELIQRIEADPCDVCDTGNRPCEQVNTGQRSHMQICPRCRRALSSGF